MEGGLRAIPFSEGCSDVSVQLLPSLMSRGFIPSPLLAHLGLVLLSDLLQHPLLVLPSLSHFPSGETFLEPVHGPFRAETRSVSSLSTSPRSWSPAVFVDPTERRLGGHIGWLPTSLTPQSRDLPPEVSDGDVGACDSLLASKTQRAVPWET